MYRNRLSTLHCNTFFMIENSSENVTVGFSRSDRIYMHIAYSINKVNLQKYL